jgi:hypothetical protein
MKLEKDKVYKFRHYALCACAAYRDFIIFSPINDIEIPIGYFEGTSGMQIPAFQTHFTVCFDKSIATKYGIRGSQTAVTSNCRMLEIRNEDYNDIKSAIVKLGHGYKYNRKLNKIIQYENN